MPDGMTFDQYIANPSGSASVVTNRNMYRDMYTKKFNELMVREQGKVEYIVFRDNDQDSYYIYLKIPSETVSGFYYDVVVRLFTTDNAKKHSPSLRNHAVQFYSNDPAFTFTFAYSFRRNKLLIQDLAPRVIQRSDVRNPKNEVFYVKSIYFAYLTMQKYNLFARAILDNKALKYSRAQLKKLIVDPEKKMDDRKVREGELKQMQKKAEQESQNKERQRNAGIKATQTKQTSAIRSTKSSKTTKTTRFTKSSKVVSATKKHQNPV